MAKIENHNLKINLSEACRTALSELINQAKMVHDNHILSRDVI